MVWWAYPLAAGIAALGGGVSSYLSGKKEKETLEADRKYLAGEAAAKRGRAGEALSGYGSTPYKPYSPATYTPYSSPLQGQTESVLSQYLSGKLAPEQEAILSQQRSLGEAGIARTAAGRGTPGGGQAALAVQLGRDIGLGAGQMALQNQQYGLSQALPYMQFGAQQAAIPQEIAREEQDKAYRYGLADYLRAQEAEARRKELLAQYS